MRSVDAIKELHRWDRRGVYLFDNESLKLVLGEDGNAYRSTLRRLLADEVLLRVARGLYVYALSSHIGGRTIYDVACALRPGKYVYESFESAASQWGIISQIPIDRVTVATTGGSGEFKTPFGVVEYAHVDKTPLQILEGVADRSPRNPLPIASRRTALDDMLSVSGRCTELIDWEAVEDDD